MTVPAVMTLLASRAHCANPVHAAAVVNLLDAYARDPMGVASL